MPCYSGEPGEWAGELTREEMEAVLCGIIRKHGEKILLLLDYEEIGVTRNRVGHWWTSHLKKDLERKIEEGISLLDETVQRELRQKELRRVLEGEDE